jgi:drug/metabolite transporter (DMT)-like permease
MSDRHYLWIFILLEFAGIILAIWAEFFPRYQSRKGWAGVKMVLSLCCILGGLGLLFARFFPRGH